MTRWVPRWGWSDLSPRAAHDLGLEQASRWRWQMWIIEWGYWGIGLMVRAFVGDKA